MLAGLRRLSDRAEQLVNEERIGLAVTGLSRAGKTVFITSLVNNLLALERVDTLPLLTGRLGGRLRRVRILPPEGDLPAFDYAAKLASLAADAPAWPAPTEALARLSLSLAIERTGRFGGLLPERRLRLDILDYPGEWLLDLPLLSQSFARWSAETLALLRGPSRAALAGRFLAWLDQLRADDRPDPVSLAHGAALYRQSLAEAAARGLRYLQPGRFVAPVRPGEPEFMAFFPLDGRGPVADLLAARFAAYQRDMRRRFFDSHFRRFDRQLVLVDLLAALADGEAAFADAARALGAIEAALRHGWGGFGGWHDRLDALPGAHRLPPLLLGGRVVPRPITHVAFVATKADHVPPMKREHLRHLLAALAGGAIAAGPRASHHVVAAVRSTEDTSRLIDGIETEMVIGTILGEARARAMTVGEVPSAVPGPAFWRHPFLRVPVLTPPRIAADGSAGIGQLGMDAALAALIGDQL